MLDSLREASKSWIAKALLLLLLASFAFWGISGQILSSGSGNAVVTAGETKVSALDYRLAYDRQMAIYSRQFGQRITREQARLFGIDQQVLGQIAAGAVLDEQSRIMNLGLSKDRLAALVAEDPAFQGVNGQFSRQNFSSVLRSVGMSEDDYIENREDVAIRSQIVEAVADGIAVPQAMLEAIAQYDGETRSVDYITVTDQAIEPVSAPDQATLEVYFEENKDTYRAPEYRKINYVRLTPSEILDASAVSEDEVRADYDARKDRFSTPETRTIEQLVFSDEAEATAASERILAGEPFEDAVTAAGKTMADVALGTLKRSDIPDPAVAEAAFSVVNAGDVSGVIEGAFGSVIVRVSEINPTSVEPYEEVAEQIRRELALVEANDVLLDIHDAYEDARAGGQTMQEAASAQKLEMRTIDMVDAEGLDPEGNPATEVEELEELLSSAFEADERVDNPPINAADTGFIWYEVDGITPSRDRTLDEVRDRVEKDWIAQETARRIEGLANELAEKLAGGTTLTQIADEGGYAVQSKFGLQRNSNDADFGARGTAEIFDGGPEHIGAVVAPAGQTFNVFKVTGVTQALGGAEIVSEQVRDNVQSSLADDLLDQMVAKLQSQYAVTVNQSAIERALATQ
jgi:peptidyl-prolyl cis-trans isomerase D